MSSIQVAGLNKHFGGVQALRDINLEISSGEFVVFVGPSGCGKSTLLRAISGLESISSGSIMLNGQEIQDLPPSKRGLAMVFQSYALYPHMSVRENMAYSLTIGRLPKDEVNRRVDAAAEKLQLTDYLDRTPKALSGGQRQRVAIGRAIVRDPKVFLFDEPLSNLDAALRVQMRMEIGKLSESLPSTTMIYVTHDQVEAMTMADRIVVLRAGVIEQVGTPMELYQRPNSLFVAQFIGSPKMNVLRGADAAEFGADAIGIRPEHLEISTEGRWRGTVIYSENLGSDRYVYLDGAGKEPIIIRYFGDAIFASGAVLKFSPAAGQVHRFDAAGRRIPEA